VGGGDLVILAIDTSAGTSVALVSVSGEVLAQWETGDTMRHAEVVGSGVARVLAEAGKEATEVTLVAAGVGPGPFTGLRVGLAAAVAFATARDIPLLPTVSHDAIARGYYGAVTGAGEGLDQAAGLRVVTDARRKEVYWSEYSGVNDGIPVRTQGPALAKPEELATLATTGAPVRLDATTVSAADLALVALAEHAADIVRTFEPLYLRSPDVTLSAGPKRVVQ
jgi:tRNA threonylcarbamoyl adenosine modification protein YeaZ